MPFEFLSSLDTTTLFLVLIIFILFVLSMKRIMSIVMNAVWIAVASVLFPIVMNRFLGYDIPMDPDSIISFMLLGLGLYFAYLVGKSVYKMLSIAEKGVKKAVPERGKKEGKEKEEKEKGTDSDKKELKKRQKELEEREKELQKKEQEVRWRQAVESGKGPRGYDEREYAVIKDRPESEPEKRERKSPAITPLPVIGHRPKKKKHKKK